VVVLFFKLFYAGEGEAFDEVVGQGLVEREADGAFGRLIGR